jgi:hypothetical protein
MKSKIKGYSRLEYPRERYLPCVSKLVLSLSLITWNGYESHAFVCHIPNSPNCLSRYCRHMRLLSFLPLQLSRHKNVAHFPARMPDDNDNMQHLASLVLEFLSTSTMDGTVTSDKKERIEVASKCTQSYRNFKLMLTSLLVQGIAKAFHIDPVNAHHESGIEPSILQSAFDDYFRTPLKTPTEADDVCSFIIPAPQFIILR